MNSLSMLEAAQSAAPQGEADPPLYEVLDGRRVEMPPMSYHAVKVASRLMFALNVFARAHGLGEAVTEALFRLPLPQDRDRHRRQDVAFVSFARWPQDRPDDYADNAWDVVPDLAVEVVSPHDVVDDQTQKLVEYFQAGVRQVWVVHPRQRLVYVFDSLTQVRGLTGGDDLDGAPLFPGLRLRLADLFGPEPPAAAPVPGS
jgi:Uma2 family endonuclease